MVQIFIILGSSIFVLLAVIHGVHTLQDVIEPRNFTPRDTELRVAMQQATVAFHPKINLWQAWLGFHFSHTLALLMFGGAFLYIGIFQQALFSRSLLLQSCSVLIPATYVAISLKFWFSNPAVFAGVSMACFILAAALSNV